MYKPIAVDIPISLLRRRRSSTSRENQTPLSGRCRVKDSDLDLDKPQRILGQWAAQKNVTMVDPLPHFRAYQASHPGERLYFYPDVHMNVNGHREMAVVLQDALRTVVRNEASTQALK